ncbi:MAG: type I-U CRISPR-associated protein Cas8c [Thermoguttaceae bacterium]
MSNTQPNITVPVDLTNPGQFFACCGLLELADRLWPGAEGKAGVVGWFERRQFCLRTDGSSRTLAELLDATRQLRTWVDGVLEDPLEESNDDEEEESDKEPPFQPFCLRWQDGKEAIYLDWWSDKSIKPWAGSMKDRSILRAMLAAIDPSHASPFYDLRAVFDPAKSAPVTDGKKSRKKASKKREPFYFDPRRGNKSHPLDSGFSPDVHKKVKSECCPALETLCFIGLQRARPAPTDVANQSRYTVWTKASDDDAGLPVSLVGPVTCGMTPWPSLGTAIFDNYFRTDQRKHKTFSQATLERSNNV